MHPVRFVLVRPGHGGNVGAAARALKNMGQSSWTLVAPATDLDHDAMRRLARGATDLVQTLPVVATLEEAIADCRWVVGTSRRAGRRRLPPMDACTFARRVAAEPERHPVAVLFGSERDGLTAPEIDRCHAMLRIDTSTENGSLNLAQAVLLVAYELRKHGATRIPGPVGRTEPGPRAGGAVPPGPAATAAELEGLYQHLEHLLLRIGFVRPETLPHQMRVLRHLLGRARPTPHEVTQLRGICRQALWAVGTAAPLDDRHDDPPHDDPLDRGDV